MKNLLCSKYIHLIIIIISVIILLIAHIFNNHINTVDSNIVNKLNDIDLSTAKKLYNSTASNKIGQDNYFDGKNLISKYSHLITKYCKEETCYVFEIEDIDLKLYAFDLNENKNNDVYLFQMAIVDETLLEREDVFSIGDSIEYVKQMYPKIQLIENTYVISHGDKYYFEILNNAGLYSYGLDTNGYVVSIQKFNFDTFSMDYIDIDDNWHDNKLTKSDDNHNVYG